MVRSVEVGISEVEGGCLWRALRGKRRRFELNPL